MEMVGPVTFSLKGEPIYELIGTYTRYSSIDPRVLHTLALNNIRLDCEGCDGFGIFPDSIYGKIC